MIVLSAFNGLSDLVTLLYGSFDAEIEITASKGKSFDVNNTKIQELKQLESIEYFSEVIEGNALLKYDNQQCIATVKGVSDTFRRMSGFDSLVFDGSFDLSNHSIVLGNGVNYLLGASANSYTPISVYAPKRGAVSKFDVDGGLNELKMFSSGTFSINDEFDLQYVFMSLANARDLLGFQNQVTSIELGLNSTSNAEEEQVKIATLLGAGFVVKSRAEQNAVLYKTMESEKLWVFIILVFILIVATFNVIGSLTMLIIEKKKDISILKYMGATNGTIRSIFFIEGLMITLIGAFIGLFLGFSICWIQQHYPLIRFAEGYVVDAYPIKMLLSDFMLILFAVVSISLFAAWYPVTVFTRKED